MSLTTQSNNIDIMDGTGYPSAMMFWAEVSMVWKEFDRRDFTRSRMIEFGGTPAISSMFSSYQANKYTKNKEKRNEFFCLESSFQKSRS
jgi:hypothetical protein